MATVVIEKQTAAPTPPPRTHRFTVEEYERLGEIGILTVKDRVELIEGWIVDKMTQNPPHNLAGDNLAELLRALVPSEWRVREQKAIRLSTSVPEPDVSVVQAPMSRYAKRHPGPADIALLVEVAESSLADDRVLMTRVYARAKIPVYWIINLKDRQVEVYTQPKVGRNAAYQQRHDYRVNETVPVVIAGKEVGQIAVKDILP
jgi:Uma2 family endonuclease